MNIIYSTFFFSSRQLRSMKFLYLYISGTCRWTAACRKTGSRGWSVRTKRVLHFFLQKYIEHSCLTLKRISTWELTAKYKIWCELFVRLFVYKHNFTNMSVVSLWYLAFLKHKFIYVFGLLPADKITVFLARLTLFFIYNNLFRIINNT